MAFRGLRVLMVDDNQCIREMIMMELLSWGWEVEVACNGKKGVEKYHEFKPDVVLMDLEMPVLNGYDTSRQIVGLDPQACILLLTGMSEALLAKKSIEEGYTKGILAKPINLQKVQTAIGEALRRPRNFQRKYVEAWAVS